MPSELALPMPVRRHSGFVFDWPTLHAWLSAAPHLVITGTLPPPSWRPYVALVTQRGLEFPIGHGPDRRCFVVDHFGFLKLLAFRVFPSWSEWLPGRVVALLALDLHVAGDQFFVDLWDEPILCQGPKGARDGFPIRFNCVRCKNRVVSARPGIARCWPGPCFEEYAVFELPTETATTSP